MQSATRIPFTGNKGGYRGYVTVCEEVEFRSRCINNAEGAQCHERGRFRVPSTTAVSISWEEERAELQAVLRSPLFSRSPTLTHLLTYLCEKTFAGETDQIKEYSVALDVFDRQDSFDQDTDSIVRVQANRLRKRLGEYYAGEGAAHALHISIPVGQYVPQFLRVPPTVQIDPAQNNSTPSPPTPVRDLAIGRFWFI